MWNKLDIEDKRTWPEDGAICLIKRKGGVFLAVFNNSNHIYYTVFQVETGVEPSDYGGTSVYDSMVEVSPYPGDEWATFTDLKVEE